MREELRPITFSLTHEARRRMEEIIAAAPVPEDAGPAMLTVTHQWVPLDSGEVAETLYVYAQRAMGDAAQLAAVRPLAQMLDGVLIFYHPDDREHAALDGRIIDHAEGDGFFLRDPVSGADNRRRALGGSEWPRWVARGARGSGHSARRSAGPAWRPSRPSCTSTAMRCCSETGAGRALPP